MDNASLQSHRSKNKRNLLRKFVGFCMVHIFGAANSKGSPKEMSCHFYALYYRSVDHWKFPVAGRRRKSCRAASPRITARRFSHIWTAIFWTPRRTQVQARRSAPVPVVGPFERPTVWCKATRRRHLLRLWRRLQPRVTPAVCPLASVYRRCRRNRRSEESSKAHDWPSTAAPRTFSRRKIRCQTAPKVTRRPAIC